MPANADGSKSLDELQGIQSAECAFRLFLQLAWNMILCVVSLPMHNHTTLSVFKAGISGASSIVWFSCANRTKNSRKKKGKEIVVMLGLQFVLLCGGLGKE